MSIRLNLLTASDSDLQRYAEEGREAITRNLANGDPVPAKWLDYVAKLEAELPRRQTRRAIQADLWEGGIAIVWSDRVGEAVAFVRGPGVKVPCGLLTFTAEELPAVLA